MNKTKNNNLNICNICSEECPDNLGNHIRSMHGVDAFKEAIINAKKHGASDSEIGAVFKINLKQLETIITEAFGVNVSFFTKKKKIKHWEPEDYKMEQTTVWSFKQRGSWATHDGRYRGNWSPFIPRNVILKYSHPGDVVLDYFIGSGTTAIEAKLLGRKCIGIDINPACVALTLKNLEFEALALFSRRTAMHNPTIKLGDARNLTDIHDETIDLICTHPPYAGIINYSSNIEDDLSKCNLEQFLNEMRKVAQESYRVLKPGKICAILIGDTRKHAHVIPMGFWTIEVFLEAGFKLRELIIKRQHNCKTTGFWYNKSIKYNFLLLAHEYLPIFEKPEKSGAKKVKESSSVLKKKPFIMSTSAISNDIKPETTTVWILPRDNFDDAVDRNVRRRYSSDGTFLEVAIASGKVRTAPASEKDELSDLLYIKYVLPGNKESNYAADVHELAEIIKKVLEKNKKARYIAMQTSDKRTGNYIVPLAKLVLFELQSMKRLWLKEIIIAVPENHQVENKGQDSYVILHRYLMVYEVVREK